MENEDSDDSNNNHNNEAVTRKLLNEDSEGYKDINSNNNGNNQDKKPAFQEQRNNSNQSEITTETFQHATSLSQRRKRMVMGLTYQSGNMHQHGKLPRCNGCKEIIERCQGRLVHRFKKQNNHNYATEYRYHLLDECVNTMSSKDLKDLKEKKFREGEMTDFLQHLQTPRKEV